MAKMAYRIFGAICVILLIGVVVTNNASTISDSNHYIHSTSTLDNGYNITVTPDGSFPRWNEYDYEVERVEIRWGYPNWTIDVTVKNNALCQAQSAWGWYSPSGRSCYGEWDFDYTEEENVDISFRAGDTSPEPGATYRIELDDNYLGDANIPATDSWYIVTIKGVHITAGHHTLFLGTYQMDYYPDIHLDYIMVGNLRIEAEAYNAMGGNDPNPNKAGLTVYPRDIVVQVWDGDPNNGGKFIGEAIAGRQQEVIDLHDEHTGYTYYVRYIENGGNYIVSIPWSPSRGFIHTIYVAVDPSNNLNETDEENNVMERITLSQSFQSPIAGYIKYIRSLMANK